MSIRPEVTRSRFDLTPKEWLPFGQHVMTLANAWSGRSDIISFVGEGAGQGAPACFAPDTSELEVDVTAVFPEGTDPATIGDMTDRSVMRDHPIASGAILHEAMHARHTRWSLKEFSEEVTDPRLREVVMHFEESRIEARGVRQCPDDRSFLRGSAMGLVLGDLPADADLSSMALLILARVDAGVLEEEDVEDVRRIVTGVYGEELLEKLRDIWRRAQRHRLDTEWRPLYHLAKEWVQLLKDNGHEPDRDQGQGSAAAAASDAIRKILDDVKEAVEARAADEGFTQMLKEQANEELERAAKARSEREKNYTSTDRVFANPSKTTGASPKYTPVVREPSGAERAAAVTLAKALERAQYRDRVVVRQTSSVPPGRLRGREAMFMDAARSQGRIPVGEPWSGKRRVHHEDPELKIGVMVDISGSMRNVMESSGATAWVLSEAARRIQGQVSVVMYGETAFPMLSPGERAGNVKVFPAQDRTEEFELAFRALDGKMNLLAASGARLLVVVSDLRHRPEQKQFATDRFKACRKAGVGVVVVAPDDRMVQNATTLLEGNGLALKVNAPDPVDMANKIGQAALEQLRQAG